jgi:hypothetical protein
MSHTIDELRDHLFATIQGLRDPDKPLDIERAKAVAEVAQTIINSAKVEVDHMRVSGRSESTGFIAPPALADSGPAKPAGLQVVRDDKNGKTTVEQRDGVTITRHIAK